MKNNIIEILKDETLTKVEAYNQLVTMLSQKKGLFAIRNYQTGYSEAKYDSVVFEIKKAFEISDLVILEYVKEVEEPQDLNPDNLTDEQKEAAATAHALEVAERLKLNADPNLEKFYAELEKDDDAKAGLKLHEEYPFLDEESTPAEMKALVADKFAAYRKFGANHGALVEGLEAGEAEEKIYELAKGAVESFQLEKDIKKELDHYKANGKVLGRVPQLNDLAIAQEIADATEAELITLKDKSQKNASKARKEIDNDGTNEAREKRVHDWELRGKLSTERLEKEFAKKK